MLKIISKLENTYIKGVLIKKGENSLTSKDFEIINKSPVFQTYIKYGHVSSPAIIKEGKRSEDAVIFKKSNNMTYAELVAYAKKNNLKPKTMKKVDILAEIEKMKGKN